MQKTWWPSAVQSRAPELESRSAAQRSASEWRRSSSDLSQAASTPAHSARVPLTTTMLAFPCLLARLKAKPTAHRIWLCDFAEPTRTAGKPSFIGELVPPTPHWLTYRSPPAVASAAKVSTPPASNMHVIVLLYAGMIASACQGRLYLIDCRPDTRCSAQLLQMLDSKVGHPNQSQLALRVELLQGAPCLRPSRGRPGLVQQHEVYAAVQIPAIV